MLGSLVSQYGRPARAGPGRHRREPRDRTGAAGARPCLWSSASSRVSPSRCSRAQSRRPRRCRYFDELVNVAAQNGVTGVAQPAGEGATEAPEEVEGPRTPGSPRPTLRSPRATSTPRSPRIREAAGAVPGGQRDRRAARRRQAARPHGRALTSRLPARLPRMPRTTLRRADAGELTSMSAVVTWMTPSIG